MSSAPMLPEYSEVSMNAKAAGAVENCVRVPRSSPTKGIAQKVEEGERDVMDKLEGNEEMS